MKGLVHIYEGTGKGKSTAGVGLTIRCAGNGFPVVFSDDTGRKSGGKGCLYGVV